MPYARFFKNRDVTFEPTGEAYYADVFNKLTFPLLVATLVLTVIIIAVKIVHSCTCKRRVGAHRMYAFFHIFSLQIWK
jgi:hypothetical protein